MTADLVADGRGRLRRDEPAALAALEAILAPGRDGERDAAAV